VSEQQGRPISQETAAVEGSSSGATVVITGRPAEPGASIAAAFSTAGAVVEHLPDAGPSDLASIAERRDRLDVLVHVVAPAHPDAMLHRTDAAWDAAIAGLVSVPIHLLTAGARLMARSGGGSIVVVGTLDAVHAYPGRADASLAMGALLGFVRSMAVELAPSGIRANSVLAGPLDAWVDDVAPGRLDRTLLRSPSGRLVTPAEVAAAVRFVAGPGAGFMTGATLRVDAGWASLNQAPDGMRFP
jgi:NAD(P)-dependent dehydrogenase (short-subunit alcohol dehydrogenase family)